MGKLLQVHCLPSLAQPPACVTPKVAYIVKNNVLPVQKHIPCKGFCESVDGCILQHYRVKCDATTLNTTMFSNAASAWSTSSASVLSPSPDRTAFWQAAGAGSCDAAAELGSPAPAVLAACNAQFFPNLSRQIAVLADCVVATPARAQARSC